MVRKKREKSPDHFYHVVSRGNRRDPLFQDERDIAALQAILSEVQEKMSFELSSYCFMTNHYHLQIRFPHESISKVMALINWKYARYYNTRYRLSGHVFEERFHSDIIKGILGNLKVSYYIHMNPVKAQIVEKPEDYPWSSYPIFHNLSSAYPSFFSPTCLLQYYEGTLEEKKNQYIQDLQEYEKIYLNSQE